jgi:hypothetical protein
MSRDVMAGRKRGFCPAMIFVLAKRGRLFDHLVGGGDERALPGRVLDTIDCWTGPVLLASAADYLAQNAAFEEVASLSSFAVALFSECGACGLDVVHAL